MRVHLVLCLLAMILSSPARADNTLSGEWQRYGTFYFPSWQTAPDPLVESDFDKLVLTDHGGTQTFLELIPKGQGDVNWRKRHLVAAFTNVSATPERVMNNNVRSFGEDCGTNVVYYVEEERRRNVMFWMVCGRMKDSGQGQVSMIRLGKRGSTLIRVSEEWRVPARATAEAVLQRLNRAQLDRAISLVKAARTR